MTPTRLLATLVMIAGMVITSDATAQNPTVVGGGCPNRAAPSVSGSLTIGSTMTLDMACAETANSMRFMLFGVELPATSRVPVVMQTSFQQYATCSVSIFPAIVVADFSTTFGPIPIPIPNDPIWQGFPLGLQSYCVECGFSGCYPTLSPGIVVTIG